MKKIVLSLAVLASVALVSCGGKKAENADSDSMLVQDTIEVAEVATDSDTMVAVSESETVTPAAEATTDSAAKK